jgi:hypothetical protein
MTIVRDLILLTFIGLLGCAHIMRNFVAIYLVFVIIGGLGSIFAERSFGHFCLGGYLFVGIIGARLLGLAGFSFSFC